MLVKVFPSQANGNYFSFRIDQKIIGYVRDRILNRNRILPESEVGNMCPCEFIFFDGFFPFVGVPVERNTQYSKSIPFISLVSFYEIRVFCPAGSAPRSPEINQHILTSERR